MERRTVACGILIIDRFWYDFPRDTLERLLSRRTTTTLIIVFVIYFSLLITCYHSEIRSIVVSRVVSWIKTL